MIYNEPICKFKDQAELDECLQWWMEKLFLTDWTIRCRIVHPADFELEDSCGENLMVFDNKEAMIHLLHYDDFHADSIVKICQEKILVHELLHCLYNFMKPAETNYEGKFVDVMDHQRLDAMAKSLIMVKYNIPFSWFAAK